MRLFDRLAAGSMAVLMACMPALRTVAHDAPAAALAASRLRANRVSFERFKEVQLDHADKPHHVVLLLSGEEGITAALATLAHHMAEKGAFVAAIDAPRYRSALEAAAEKCVSPSSDLENLSHYLQSRAGLKSYIEPTLVGYGSGANLAYATLDEAPDGLFTGAVTLGFDRQLKLHKPLCKGASTPGRALLDARGEVIGVELAAARHLAGKWLALQTESEAAGEAMRVFVASVPGAERVIAQIPGMGAGSNLDAAADWSPFDAALVRASVITAEGRGATLPASLADLPLHLVAASGASGANGGEWFAVFLTGDGGWVAIDKGISQELARHNIPVVGWDSLKYFWVKRTPSGTSKDLERVLTHFARAWGRSHALVIGYSQGADTLPFMVNRLSPSARSIVGFTTLLGLSDNAVFEFHVTNWLGNPSGGLRTAPELQRWSGSPYFCLYGESDPDAACRQLTGHDGSYLSLPGGHHFNNAYGTVAAEILKRMPGRSPPDP